MKKKIKWCKSRIKMAIYIFLLKKLLLFLLKSYLYFILFCFINAPQGSALNKIKAIEIHMAEVLAFLTYDIQFI